METKDDKHKYSCREEEIRATLTLEECVHRITKIYGWEYDQDTPTFDAWNQLLACEAVTGSSPVREQVEQIQETNENVNGNGMYSDGCKHRVYFELTPSKQGVITELTRCNYRTSPIKVAALLTKFFIEWPSLPNHWLYIARTYNPRAINRTIIQIIKSVNNGNKILNAAALFTYLIKEWRKPRRSI